MECSFNISRLKSDFWLSTYRLNYLNKFGNSDVQIISNLIGKSYKATIKEDCVIPDLNDLNHNQETAKLASKAITTKNLHLI